MGMKRRPARRVSVLEEQRLLRYPWKIEQAFKHPHRASVFSL